jgi:hypothetical protein
LTLILTEFKFSVLLLNGALPESCHPTTLRSSHLHRRFIEATRPTTPFSSDCHWFTFGFIPLSHNTKINPYKINTYSTSTMPSLSRRIASWNPRRQSQPEKEEEELTQEQKQDEIIVTAMPAPVPAPAKRQEREHRPLFVSEDDEDDDDDEDIVPPQPDLAFKRMGTVEHHIGEAIQFAERERSLITVDCNEAQGWGKRTICCASPSGMFDDSSMVNAAKAAEPLFIKVLQGDPAVLQQRSWDIVRENSMTADHKNKPKGRAMRPKTIQIVSEAPDSGILDEGDWEGMKSAIESHKKKQAAPIKSEKKSTKRKFLSSLRRITGGKKKNSIKEVLSQCTAPAEDDDLQEMQSSIDIQEMQPSIDIQEMQPSIDTQEMQPNNDTLEMQPSIADEPEIVESESLEVVYSNGEDCLMHSEIHREQVVSY